MEYATAEKVIRFYSNIDSEINIRMKFLADIENNYYCSIGGQAIDGMPHGKNKTTNITELLALSIPTEIKEEYQIIQKSIKDLCACRSAITQSINTLNTVEKNIIIKFYLEGRKWEYISEHLKYSVRQCKNIRRRAIHMLSYHFDKNKSIKKFFPEN